jgi:hypothetical protein
LVVWYFSRGYWYSGHDPEFCGFPSSVSIYTTATHGSTEIGGKYSRAEANITETSIIARNLITQYNEEGIRRIELV